MLLNPSRDTQVVDDIYEYLIRRYMKKVGLGTIIIYSTWMLNKVLRDIY
jgi:hypothetical protein